MRIEELRELVRGIVQESMGELRELQRSSHDERLVQLISAARGEMTVRADERGLNAARFVRALAASKGDPERAAHWAKRNWGDDHVVVKSLLASDNVAGGVLIDATIASDFIELLRERSVVRRLGPRVIPMSTGIITIKGQASGGTASYIGETQNIPVTQPTFRDVTLTWKKLAALTPISNDLLRFNSPQADQIVRDDLVAVVSLREDQAFLRDDGTEGTPKGLRWWPSGANVFAASSTVNLANVTADLGKAILALQEGHSRMIAPAWIMAPRTAMYLRTVRDGNGNFAFRDEMNQGRLFEAPFATTTQIPTNLGSGGDESEVILVDMADVLLGEAQTMTIEVSSEAAYHDGSQVQAAFSRDETVMRIIEEHDLGVRHPESIAVITGVKWIP
jgi:HK97 family phage major capsid protein